MEIINWIIDNWDEILKVAASVVAIAAVIAKITPNETDNEYVEKAQKVLDVIRLHTDKTKLIKK